jgi:hypothetical protein
MIHFAAPQIAHLSLCASTNVRRNSLGMFDKLPLEILHEVFQLLDFHKLSVVRSVNFASQSVIDTLPTYNYMTQYVPTALGALSKTRLITTYTVGYTLQRSNYL